VLGTTVGVGTALGPLVGGALIALGGSHIGWRLVFFVNIPIGVAVIVLARRLLPAERHRGRHRLDVLGATLLGAATFCILFAAVQYDTARDARLGLLAIPAAALFVFFFRRERRLTAAELDPLVDLRLFRTPSYAAGVLFALAYFPAMAGLPLVLALYYQDGLGYTALQSGLGVTAYALGSSVGAPLAGRVVTRIGRRLLLLGMVSFAAGAIALAALAGHGAAALAPALFVMGAGSGAIITPNQALTLMQVDPVAGSTAGGVLQTAQRIGIAVGQAVIGATFFVALHRGGYPHALRLGVVAALAFLLAATATTIADLVRRRRVST
jgi:MFS family permease